MRGFVGSSVRAAFSGAAAFGVHRFFAFALLGLALTLPAIPSVMAQSGAPVPDATKQGQSPATDGMTPEQRRVKEFTDAAQAISGPAGNPECVWLGRRVVGLLWRDDLDTAFRHLDLYDRFGCPGGHIQAAFRCMAKGGAPDPKTQDLSTRVHTCWVNPAAQIGLQTQTPPPPAPAK
jgi:hypothetical protein